MTYREAYQELRRMLTPVSGEAASFEAHVLLEELCGVGRIEMLSGGSLTGEEQETLFSAARRRCQGEPLQYLVGRWPFAGREFYVGPGVLIPRDDTEAAVDTCREALSKLSSGTVVDLCSGSGIIAVTLANDFPRLSFEAVELSDRALPYLRKNAALYHTDNLRVIQGDIFSCFRDYEEESLAAIIANPPYIETAEIAQLQQEIAYEPVMALDGGKDGLDFYRCIAGNWLPKLQKGGSLTLEIGETQAEAVCHLLSEHGMEGLRVIQDIQRLDRVIFGTKIS